MKDGKLGLHVNPSERHTRLTISLPVNAKIQSASLQVDNGAHFLFIHYTAEDDNSSVAFKDFHVSFVRYTSSYVQPKNKIHLCDLEDGLYTYGVFYTP